MLRGGDSNVKKFNTVSRRIFILSIAKGIVFTGIIAKLFSLQISENKKYLTLSDKNRLREWRLPPVRGEFLDYFGKLVAGNTVITGKVNNNICNGTNAQSLQDNRHHRITIILTKDLQSIIFRSGTTRHEPQ